jgi:hypothetical protein
LGYVFARFPVNYFLFFYRFAPLLTSAQLSLLSPESHIVPLTAVVGLGQKMLKVSLLHCIVADPDPETGSTFFWASRIRIH